MTVALEGLKAGQYDFRAENSAKNWATQYDFPAIKQGNVKKEMPVDLTPQGMQGFLYNTRKPLFQDIRVRQALAYAFDFEWSRQTSRGSTAHGLGDAVRPNTLQAFFTKNIGGFNQVHG